MRTVLDTDLKHYGKFAFKMDLLNMYANTLMCDVFGHMIIIRAEYDKSMDAVLYAAWSQKFFRKLKDDEVAPTYIFHVKDGEITAQEIKDE